MGWARAQGTTGISGFAAPQGEGHGFDPAQGCEGMWLPTYLGSSLAAWYKADAGCYTDAAMLCAAASSQYASRTSEAALQAADVDFSFACYFKPASADRMFIAGKGDGNGTGEEWWLEYTALGAIYFGFGSASGNQGAQSPGTYSPGDPLFIVGTYTQSTGVGRVYVNGSLVGTSSALGAAHVSSSAPLSIGRDGQYNGLYTNGVVGRAGLWIGRALSAGDVTSLYNAGAGKFYADLTTAEKVSLVEYWNLCEASGSRVGSHAGLNLTPTNGPTVAAGPGEGFAVNNSPVKRIEDQSGAGLHATQSTIGKQGLWIASAQNGRPGILLDGVDDYYALPSMSWGAFTKVLATKWTAAAIAIERENGGTVTEYIYSAGSSWRHSTTDGDSGYNDNVDGAAWMNGTYVVTHRSDGTHAGHIARRNGVVRAGTAAASGAPGSTSRASVGTLGGRAASLFSAGHFMEVILANAALSDPQTVSAESYMNTRYAIY